MEKGDVLTVKLVFLFYPSLALFASFRRVEYFKTELDTKRKVFSKKENEIKTLTFQSALPIQPPITFPEKFDVS